MLMCDSVILADKSEISDTFPGLLEPFPSPWTCMRALNVPGQLSGPSASSVHDLVLLAGMSSGSGSAVRALKFLCITSCIRVVFNTLLACLHVRHVRIFPGLTFVVYRPSCRFDR